MVFPFHFGKALDNIQNAKKGGLKERKYRYIHSKPVFLMSCVLFSHTGFCLVNVKGRSKAAVLI